LRGFRIGVLSSRTTERFGSSVVTCCHGWLANMFTEDIGHWNCHQDKSPDTTGKSESVERVSHAPESAQCDTGGIFVEWSPTVPEADAGREAVGGDPAEDFRTWVVCSLEEKHHCCAPKHEPPQPGDVLLDSHEAYVVAKGCKNRYCPDCCESTGIKLRERVRDRIADWKSAILVTLTVDPTIYGAENPEAAYLRVRSRRAIARLVRSLVKTGHLTSGRYFVVLEFQANGMPHWHLLLESSFVPIERIQHVWNLNRPDGAGPVEPNRPGFGFCWVSKSSFEDMQHAANYVTKYCLKQPQNGYPAWVLDFVGRVPKYATSRKFWGEDGEAGQVEKMEAEACFCVKCRGEQPAGGVWKEITLPPEDWQVMGREDFRHNVETLEDGNERKLVWFPSDGETVPRERAKTIRERIGRCGEVGAVLLHRQKYVEPEPGLPARVTNKWYWLGMLSMPFAEYAELVGVEGRRHAVTLEEAERLGGRSWMGPRDQIRKESYEQARERAEERERTGTGQGRKASDPRHVQGTLPGLEEPAGRSADRGAYYSRTP
jgi:hypothetical protein